MIVAKNIHKFYENKHILKGIDIKIEEGEIVSLIGSSGAGKTTLLQILSTIEKYEAGYDSMLSLNGINLDALNKNDFSVDHIIKNNKKLLNNILGYNFRLGEIEAAIGIEQYKKDNKIGKYVDVKIKECNSATLFGEIC